ncbi:hypothetical protein SLA2020_466680 [Shorea laevis]
MAIPTQLVILPGLNQVGSNNRSLTAQESAAASSPASHGTSKTHPVQRNGCKQQKRRARRKMENRSEEQSGDSGGKKLKLHGKHKNWARELTRSRIWYLTSPISYILRKARAFCNEFCCDSYNDRIRGNEAMLLANPYFSIPVIPPPSVAQVM